MTTLSNDNAERLLRCLESIQLATARPDATQAEREIYSDIFRCMSSALGQLRDDHSNNVQNLTNIILDYARAHARDEYHITRAKPGRAYIGEP
jgi:hypothetical protein